MYKGKRIAVVVPARNEREMIARTIETMPDFVDGIFVVDDASTDETAGIVQGLIDANHRPLHLIRHEKNTGVGGAIITGYKRCLEDGFDVVAVMAGDAQMNPDDLPRVLDPVVEEKAHYVKGNRLFTGEAWRKIPKHRYLGNAFLSLMTKMASGYWHVADSQTGYTAISREALQRIDLEKVWKGYGYPNDILVRLNVYDFVVADVPVEPVYHANGKSGIRLWKVIPQMSWLLFRLFWWRMKEKYIIRDFHPLIFFYLFGTLLFWGGAGFGIYLLVMRFVHGAVAATSALFAVFLTITGLQLLLFAMQFDAQRNTHLKSW